MEEKIEALQTAYEYIPKLNDAIAQVTGLFTEKKATRAYHLLTQIIDGVQWVLEALDLTSEVQLEKIDTQQLKGILKEFIEGMENDDHILICDMLQYEMTPILQEWQTNIGKTLEV
jgi:hypothetical protein